MPNQLLLSVVPDNTQVTCNLSWSGCSPNGHVDYLIFYYKTGSRIVKTVSTATLSVVVSSLLNDTEYNFRAKAYQGGYDAENQVGESSLQSTYPSTAPTAPDDLEGIVSTNGNVIAGKIQLSWSASSTSHYDVSSYKVYFSTDNSIFNNIDVGNVLEYELTGLQDGADYYVKVLAVNDVGNSAFSDTIQRKPLDLPSIPLNLRVNYDENAGNNANPNYQNVKIDWDSSENDGGSPITSYTIHYSLDPSFEENVFTVTDNSGSEISVHSADLIVPYASRDTSTGWYYFKVRANTTLGSGLFTLAVTIVAEVIPVAVQNLTSDNRDANSNLTVDGGVVTLRWDYAIDNACPLLGYLVAYLDPDDLDLHSQYVNDTSINVDHTFEVLLNGDNYDFSVIALNMLGQGAVSTIQQIPSTYPRAPELEIVHGNGQLTLSWNEPVDMGSAIIGYNVYRALTHNGNIQAIAYGVEDTEYVDENLDNGTMYHYKILARNANGDGPMSEDAHEYPSTVPNPPSNVSFVIVDSNKEDEGGELTLNFEMDPEDNDENGGSIITQFNVYLDNVLHGTIEALAGTTAYQYVVDGLLNAQNYVFGVSSSNRDGESAIADAQPAQSSGLPFPPTITDVTNDDTTNGQKLLVEWSHGDGNGQTITAYRIYVAEGLTFDVNGTDTSKLITGLVNGKTYNIRMASISSNGEGAKSSAMDGTPSGKPNIPTGLLLTHGDEQITVSWNFLNVATGGSNVTPSDQGSVITSYKIYYSNDEWNNSATVDADEDSFVITGLNNGVLHSVTVSAINANGESGTATPEQATPSTSPDTVRDVTVTTSSQSMEISWGKPLDEIYDKPSGGLAYLYRVIVTDDDNNTMYDADALTSTLVNVSGLDNGNIYTVAIYAYNNVDTNYNIYYIDKDIVARGVPIDDLEHDLQADEEITIKFTYPSDLHSIDQFLIVFYNSTLHLADDLMIDVDTNRTSLGNGMYEYKVLLNSATTGMATMQPSDAIGVLVYAINEVGTSLKSNLLLIAQDNGRMA